jgi:SAM-dependent methyltransferase
VVRADGWCLEVHAFVRTSLLVFPASHTVVAVSQIPVVTQSQAHALLLQRTGYQPAYVRLLRKAGLGHIYDERLSGRSTEKQRRRIGRRYMQEAEREALAIRTVVPRDCETLMDIGCGLGGFDLALTRLCPSIKRLVLVDQDRFETRPHYGFASSGSSYNSLADTADFLKANGTTATIRTVDVLTQPFPNDERVDVVVSLISWGHHYPVSTYVAAVYAVLKPGGVVVLDVRRQSGGLTDLAEVFGNDPQPLADQLDPARTLRVYVRKGALRSRGS